MESNLKKHDLIIVASVIVASLTTLMVGLAYANMLSQWMVGVTFGIIGIIATYFFKKSGKLSEYKYYLRLIEKMELPGKWDEIVDEIIEQLLEEMETSGAVKAKLQKRIEELEATGGETDETGKKEGRPKETEMQGGKKGDTGKESNETQPEGDSMKEAGEIASQIGQALEEGVEEGGEEDF